MASLDEIFYKEFVQMMNTLKGYSGAQDLTSVPLPQEVVGKFFVETRDKAAIAGINDEYYGKLNNTEVLLWGTKALKRREYDHNGEFRRDSNGNYILKDVNCPRECVAVVSPISLGVPTSHKPSEPFEYVDMVTKTVNGKQIHRFVYIVPRKYCYRLNQTALILSWNKHRVYYSGCAISLQNGHTLFLYVIPYKPSKVEHNYRILHTKTSDDYSEELIMLRDFWIKTNYMFNPAECQLMDIVKGRDNMAIAPINGVLDVYERFNSNQSMDYEESLEDVDYV